MPPILVTGGNGFIGSHVVRHLLAHGCQIRVLLRQGESTQTIDHLPLERIEGDLLNPESLRRALDGCEGLIHLAALYAIWLKDPDIIYRINVEGTRTLMELALEAGIPRIVYTSSIAAVGLHPDGLPADETVAFNAWDTADDYVISKHLAEVEVRKLITERGLPCIIVNPAFPFGPGDWGPTPTGNLLINILNKTARFYAASGLNAVDVRDVAHGHVLAWENGRVGERYILGGTNLTQHEFFEAVFTATGRRFSICRAPSWLLPFLGACYEFSANHLTGRPPLVTRKSAAYASRHLYFDSGKAQRELGLTVRPLEETIRDAVAWFRENGYVKSS